MKMISKKMERCRPRTIVSLLVLSSIGWMVCVPHGVQASRIWDGPALTPLGGAPTILAEAGAASGSAAQGTAGGPSTSARSVTTAGSASVKNTTTGGAASSAKLTTSGNHGGSPTGTSAGRQAVTGKADPVGGPNGAAATTTTGNSGATASAPKTAAPKSPALNLPLYAPAGVSGGQTLDGSTIAGLVVKFLVVLALLFIVLRILKAIMPGARGKRAGREQPLLLHSESIGDKQRVLILDLGGKLVAVGVAGTAMTELATIEEADAVDVIRARYAPLTDAVPGYQEDRALTPLSHSFIETLKRAGIVGQRQAGSKPNNPAAPAVPLVQHEPAGLAAGSGGGIARGGETRTRRAAQPPVEPVLHEALEAMRAVRRRVEGA
jgi:flagellar biogenesis protein FliO